MADKKTGLRWYEMPFTGMEFGCSDTMMAMMNFHTNPTSEEFNNIIDKGGELFKEPEDRDDFELYVDFEGETWKAKAARVADLKKKLMLKSEYNNILSNPILLSWVYAAVKQFPWLLSECSKPLIVERAYIFDDKCFSQLVVLSKRGPVAAGKHSSELTNRDIDMWNSILGKLLCASAIKYGASGDKKHLDTVTDLIDNDPRARKYVEDAFGDEDWVKSAGVYDYLLGH